MTLLQMVLFKMLYLMLVKYIALCIFRRKELMTWSIGAIHQLNKQREVYV